jgi:hypothetical protein
MKKIRPWVGIVSISFVVAVGLALVIATLGTAFGGASGSEPVQASEPVSDPQQTFEGMVTDSRCGAKHQSSIDKSATKCAVACVHAGAQFALVVGDKTYLLDGDVVELKAAAGLRATITGTLRENTITVSAISRPL